MTVTSYEQKPADIGFTSKCARQLASFDATLDQLDEAGRAGFADRIADAYLASEACRLHVLKSLSLRARGDAPGPESSVDKLLMIRAEQQLGAMDLETNGAPAILNDSSNDLLFDYLWSRSASIYGGTEQIQRTIVAERILKMPRRR